MMGYGYGLGMMGWLGGLLMLLFGALTVGGIVLVIVWAVRQSSQHSTAIGMQDTRAAGSDEAVAIVKRRLASGEITKEQYDELMQALR